MLKLCEALGQLLRLLDQIGKACGGRWLMQEVLQEPAEVAAAKKDLCEIAHRFSEERPSKGLWACRGARLDRTICHRL